MKKSTLITSIAMIVVVVVALSTATYAWFSGQTETQVDTTITTTAAEGWILYGGTYATGNVTYSSTTQLNMTLQNGLWSPVGSGTTSALASSVLGGAGATATFAQANFFEAEVNGPDYKIKTASAAKDANYIRVINNNTTNSAADTLELKIFVIVKNDNDGSYRAAAGFSTYLSTYINGGSQVAFYTAYNYGSQSTETTGTGEGYLTATLEGDKTISSGVTQTANIAVDNANAKQGFQQFSAADATKYGVTEGDYYRLITVTIGSVAKTKAVNIAFYAWLDGWVLDDTAGGATLDIIYAFGTAQA